MVDEARFTAAEAAYEAGDWRAAAAGFLAAAQAGGEEAARAYCKAGNALTHMRRWSDAAAVYRHALADPEYANRGAVWANLGAALLETGEYGEALAAYDRAIEDPDYASWRALQGRAGALAGMGRNAEAAACYRESALSEGNADPGKALNNLGLQFMALDRPEDAIEAYKAALEQDGYGGRGRVEANLGIAYLRLGLNDRAAEAFAAAEAAGFELDGPFAQARAAAGEPPKPAAQAAVEAAQTEAAAVQVDASGEDVVEPAAAPGHGSAEEILLGGSAAAATVAASAASEGQPARNEEEGPVEGPQAVPAGDSRLDTDFFDRTDDDMKRLDVERRKAERAEPRSRRGLWSALAATVLIIALLAGLVTAALLTGFGFPSQKGVTSQLLDAYKSGKPVDQYWVAVPPADIDKEMARIPPTFKSFEIGTIKNTSLNTARMQVSVTIENGSPLDYTVSLDREGVGWRVSGIDNDWRSTSSP